MLTLFLSIRGKIGIVVFWHFGVVVGSHNATMPESHNAFS